IDRGRHRKGAVMRRALAVLALCAGALFAVAALAAPDSDTLLRVSFPIAETVFDPQAAGDAYSAYVNRSIFDPLYKYDYLARPYTIVPNTAVALPEISADRKTGTLKIRPGVHF